MQQDDLAAKFSLTPPRLVLFVMACIALADLVTMWALSAFLQGLSAPVQMTVESAALAITILPIIWLFIVAPLRRAALREKIRAEELMEQSAHDWEDTFNTITDIITIHDRDFNVIRANRAARERLGVIEGGLGRQKCFRLFHGAECPPRDCPSCRSIESKKAVTSETYEPHLDMYVETRAIPRMNADKELIGLIHVVRDITKRKQLEVILESQKRFAENLVQNSAVATFVLDSGHRVVLWNKACEELTGVPAHRMIGTDDHWRPFYERKRPVLADIIIDNNYASLSTLYGKHARSSLVSNGLHAEGWYLNLNGKNRYMVFDAAPITSSDGTLLVVIETLQDIPERKRIEEELAQSESKLRSLIEAEQDCVKLLAEDGTLLEMNPAGLRMIDADSLEQVVGRSIYPLIDPHYLAAVQGLIGRVFSGESGSLEFEFTGLRGTHRSVKTRAVPLRNQEGKIIALLAVTSDITEHKKLEHQLRHAQKMEAVGTLSGGIAHDFNNILTGIIGYGELMRMAGRDSDQWEEHLDHLLASAQRAANLTRNLLAFSRKQVMSLKPVDLNAVIRGIEPLLQRIIGEDIAIKTSLSGSEMNVHADAGQLEQVLMNLAVNARDAMHRGGTLSLSTQVSEIDEQFIASRGYGTAGKYALLSVDDSGRGMDEKTRERIFEPFYTTKEVGKGTGLGLSIVYGIVKQHNGYVECVSTPKKGTAFHIHFPLIDVRVEDREPRTHHALRRGTETVLVTEDDEAVRRLTRTMLEELGYRVITAADGEEAIRLFAENAAEIELLLMDVIMPKQNGKQAYDAIRKIRPEVRILFTSGYTADVIAGRGLLEKGMHFMAKPASLQVLSQKIRDVLDAS